MVLDLVFVRMGGLMQSDDGSVSNVSVKSVVYENRISGVYGQELLSSLALYVLNDWKLRSGYHRLSLWYIKGYLTSHKSISPLTDRLKCH